ncbi:MAG: hypothetical protein N2039_12695 [Gemmataceae bacterium]|nr:hypothetical protein [Gemmataceae bacterium]
MIDEGKILSWEEAQQLMLPPEATMLVPPTVGDEVPGLTNAPSSLPDWLTEDDPEAAQAAAEREQYGPGPIRLLTQLVTMNALGQAVQSAAQSLGRSVSSTRMAEEESRRGRLDSPPPDKKP